MSPEDRLERARSELRQALEQRDMARQEAAKWHAVASKAKEEYDAAWRALAEFYVETMKDASTKLGDLATPRGKGHPVSSGDRKGQP